jgi:hypothetical protein
MRLFCRQPLPPPQATFAKTTSKQLPPSAPTIDPEFKTRLAYSRSKKRRPGAKKSCLRPHEPPGNHAAAMTRRRHAPLGFTRSTSVRTHLSRIERRPSQIEGRPVTDWTPTIVPLCRWTQFVLVSLTIDHHLHVRPWRCTHSGSRPSGPRITRINMSWSSLHQLVLCS